MNRKLAGLFVFVALAGCGQASEERFNNSFDTGFRESCNASATKGGVPADAASKVCECAIAKIGEKYTPAEKLALSAEQLGPIVSECTTTMVTQ